MSGVELAGYIASILIAASMMMSSLTRLRIFNLLGCVAMAVYGGLIGAPPVVAVNSFIALVNIYYLVRLSRAPQQFQAVALPSCDDSFLRAFVAHHGEDMLRFQPELDLRALVDPGAAGLEGFFVLRDVLPVGLFLYEERPEGVIEVHLDYVIPGYRDFKSAHFSYELRARCLYERGFRRFVAEGGAPAHRRYLRRLGFRPCADRPGALCREILGSAA